MKNIKIMATANTPVIEFETTGKLLIKGRSLPENVSKFYQPLIKWVRELHADTVIVDINLEYVNSSSTKRLLEILRAIDRNDSVSKFMVNWYYELDDEDSLENGIILESLLKKASFKFHENKVVA